MTAPQQFLIDFEEKMGKLANIRRNIQAGIEFKTQFTNDLKTKLGEINQRLRELAQLITTLKEKADNLQIQVNTNTTSIGDKERKLQQLRDQITSLTTERDNLTARIRQQEEEAVNNIAAKQAEIDRCEAALRDIQPKYEAQTLELNALREEMTKTGNEKDAAHAEQLKQLTEQSQKQLAGQEAELMQRINDCEGKIAGFEQQIKDKDAELATKQKAIDDATGAAQNAAQGLQQQIDDLKLENKNLVERLMAATVAINDAADDLQRITDDVPNSTTKQEADALLNEITQQIEQSIINIGRAAQGQAAQPSAAGQYDVEPNFNNLMQLHRLQDKRQYLAFIRTIRSGQIQNEINTNINAAENGNNDAINAVKRALLANQIKVNAPRNIGGKRRITKKNRKQKGGFTYKTGPKRRSLTSKITTKSSSRRSSR